MAYELYIEKASGAISLEGWKAAIAKMEGIRLCSGKHSIANPQSGEIISFDLRDGDAEIYFSQTKAWQPVFRWLNGKASFRAPLAENSESPVWQVATALAESLGAVIRGDGGEFYDLRTGRITNP